MSLEPIRITITNRLLYVLNESRAAYKSINTLAHIRFSLIFYQDTILRFFLALFCFNFLEVQNNIVLSLFISRL